MKSEQQKTGKAADGYLFLTADERPRDKIVFLLYPFAHLELLPGRERGKRHHLQFCAADRHM